MNFDSFDAELSLAKSKSGLYDGQTIASSACIENLLNAIEQLSLIVKEIQKNSTQTP